MSGGIAAGFPHSQPQHQKENKMNHKWQYIDNYGSPPIRIRSLCGIWQPLEAVMPAYRTSQSDCKQCDWFIDASRIGKAYARAKKEYRAALVTALDTFPL